MHLRDQRVVVVGGISGIGRAVAIVACAAGASAVVVGRSRDRVAHAVDGIQSDLAATGASVSAGQVRGIAADATSESDVERLFRELGSCDHVVNTAADLTYQPVLELDVPAAQRALSSKIVASLLLAKHAAPVLRRSGSITLTSGIAAHRPGPRGAVTAAVNGAIEALVRALALELAPIRVNAVSPGWVDTPIWDTVAGDRKEAVQSAMAARLPVRRLGTPDELASAYLFLMQNGFATGSVFQVEGGHRLV